MRERKRTYTKGSYTLQNSLVNTLERGYNINSITNALSSIASGADSVASAANRAAQALASMGAAQNTYGSSTPSDNGRKYAVISNGIRQTDFFSTKKEADDWINKNHASRSRYYIGKFAKGGIITKDKNNPLNHIAESVGEDTLIAAKDGEGVLTKEQTEAVSDLAKAVGDEKPVVAKGSGGVSAQDDLLTFKEFVALHNKNNPDAQFYPLQSSISSKTDKSDAQIKMSDSSQMIPADICNMNVNIPEFIKTDRPNVNVRYGSMLTVNGDINDTKHFVRQIEKIADRCIDRTIEKIDRDFKYSR